MAPNTARAVTYYFKAEKPLELDKIHQRGGGASPSWGLESFRPAAATLQGVMVNPVTPDGLKERFGRRLRMDNIWRQRRVKS